MDIAEARTRAEELRWEIDRMSRAHSAGESPLSDAGWDDHFDGLVRLEETFRSCSLPTPRPGGWGKPPRRSSVPSVTLLILDSEIGGCLGN